MSKPKKDPHERVRKIGEREEIIEVELTEAQLSDMKDEVMMLLEDEDRIEEKAKEAAKNFSSQIKTNQLQRNELRRKIHSRRVRQTITVEEHLTVRNEVIRVRKDNGETIGQRTATSKELQEEMFADQPAESGEAADGDAVVAGGMFEDETVMS